MVIMTFFSFCTAKLKVEVPKDSVIAMEFNPYDNVQFLLMTKQDIWIGVSGVSILIHKFLVWLNDFITWVVIF